MALENIIQSVKRYSAIGLAAFSISCGSCDDQFSQADYCLIKSNHDKIEICNNNFDENCDGNLDENCDVDNDGYCGGSRKFYFNPDKEPNVCKETFKNCLENPDLCPEGEYDCSTFYMRSQVCGYLLFDCKDDPIFDSENCTTECAVNIHPNALEVCDGYDNNCVGGTDETFPELGDMCDPNGNLGDNFPLNGVGICKAGTYSKCELGELVCSNFVGPKDREYCNHGIDDDCDPLTKENVLTDARECYTGPPGTAGVGICMKGAELCVNGEVGGDGECHGQVLPEEEQCGDCKDRNCDGTIGNDEVYRGRISITGAVDTSCSMEDDHRKLRSLSNLTEPLPCADNDNVKISTIIFGDPFTNRAIPILRGSLRTVQGYADNINNDLGYMTGPASEPSLNVIIYAACDVLERKEALVTGDICERLRPINTLRINHPDNQTGGNAFELDAKKLLIIYSDEGSHFILPYPLPQGYTEEDFPVVDQQIAAFYADLAEIDIIIYTELQYNNYDINSPRSQSGYAYFRDFGGEIRDIQSIQEPQNMKDIISNLRCLK